MFTLKQDWFNWRFDFPQSVKRLIPFLLFSIAIGINIYFRLFPAYFPQNLQKAKANVESRIIGEIAKGVDGSYPNFNNLIKTKIILKIFEEDKKNTSGFKKEIQDEYKKTKRSLSG